MDEVRPRQFSSTETINIGTLGDDLKDIKDIKSIDEADLQSYLMGTPVPEINDEEELEEVKPKKTVKKQESFMSTDEVDDYLTGKSDTKEEAEEDIPTYNKKTNKSEKQAPKEETKEAVTENEEDENIFATLNRDLVKAGIFGEDDDEVGDADSFKNKFVKEINKGANSMIDQFLSHHGPEYRQAFDAIFVNGLSPEAYFRQAEVISNLEDMDLDHIDNQEKVLRTFYKSKKFAVEKIDKKIEFLKNSGILKEEAEEVHEVLLEEQRERLEDEIAIAQENSRVREINKQNYKASLNKILNEKVKAKSFNGIPVDPNTAGKIYHNLTTDAYKLPDGSLITEFDKTIMELNRPENLEKKLVLAFLFENNLDLSMIKKEAIKEETNDMFEGLQRKKRKKEIPTANQMKSFF